MIKRQKQFLREIISTYYGVNEQELCDLGEVTEKTLKNDLKIIQNALNDFGLLLVVENGRVSIPFRQKSEFVNAYEQIIQEDENLSMAQEMEQRKMFILTYLCKSTEYVSMNMLADKMYVSKTNVSSIIHELETEIHQELPSIRLEISGRKGVKLWATERDVREILLRYFDKTGDSAIESPYFKGYLDQSEKELLPCVVEKTKQLVQDNQLVMTYRNINKIIAHVMIIQHRNQKGFYLDEEFEYQDDIYSKYIEMLKDIGLNFKENEILSLPLPLLNRALVTNPKTVEIMHQFVHELNAKYSNTIIHEEDTGQLLAHIDEMLNKGVKKTGLQNFAFNHMLRRLLNAYLISYSLHQKLEDEFHAEIDAENRIYLAMHIQGLYRKNIQIQENLLLYENNISQCDMMKTDLEKHFTSKANVVSVNASWDIEKKLQEKDFAIILTTKSILGVFNSVPVLKVNPFLKNEDYEAINQIVFKNHDVPILTANYDIKEDCIYYEGQPFECNNEVLLINGLLLTTTLQKNIPTGAYATSELNGVKLYLLNYNLNDSYLKYHRMVNSFGQMIYEKKI